MSDFVPDNPNYRWTFNTTDPKGDMQLLKAQKIRAFFGKAFNGDADQQGIYIHVADLSKAAFYYKANSMNDLAEYCLEEKKDAKIS